MQLPAAVSYNMVKQNLEEPPELYRNGTFGTTMPGWDNSSLTPDINFKGSVPVNFSHGRFSRDFLWVR
uniref:Uncharacterized protein n=1 Tax=Globodera rostochiensis TaxID=31243 RepID=A0A914H9R4_GLORO